MAYNFFFYWGKGALCHQCEPGASNLPMLSSFLFFFGGGGGGGGGRGGGGFQNFCHPLKLSIGCWV